MMNTQRKRIGCLGSGRLYQAVQPYLAQEYQLFDLGTEGLTNAETRERVELGGLGGEATLAGFGVSPNYPIPQKVLGLCADQARECSMILYCDDLWQAKTQQKINQQCLRLGIPWLRAYCEFGVGIIGPCVYPRETGCVACVETRRRAAQQDPIAFTLCSQHSEAKWPTREQPWLTASSLEVLAQLVIAEVSACLKTPDTLQTRRAMLWLSLDTLQYRRHHFLPEAACPACGKLLDDSAERAVIILQARPKLGPFTYRTRKLSAHAKEILETYVDAETGPISALVRNTDDSIAMVVARIGISSGERHSHIEGTGRALSYEQSQLAAIAEALERYGGQLPKMKRTTVQASYRQLGEQALDPTTLGLHTPEQYALAGYRYVPYHHDLCCDWVWGYSFERQTPILLPEQVGYYGRFHLADGLANTAFVYEISNGCALGNCLEEAIFYGILEVAERDAFLMAWYAQLSLPRLDPLSATDPLVGLVLENLEYESGYTISVFNSTLDHGVPCCLVLAVDERDRDGRPKALCGAGSHPNPEQAVLNALLELDIMIKRPYDWFAGQREKALTMLANPMAVKDMEDHSLLYYLPEAFARLSFLYHVSPQWQTFQAAFGDFYRREPSKDLTADLRSLIDHYLARGIDIVVVDQTAPEHTLQDFRCVKVLMPGMLPMTFGHQYRRHSGFQRLYHLPAQLGYRNRPLTDADINPHPHPFP